MSPAFAHKLVKQESYRVFTLSSCRDASARVVLHRLASSEQKHSPCLCCAGTKLFQPAQIFNGCNSAPRPDLAKEYERYSLRGPLRPI